MADAHCLSLKIPEQCFQTKAPPQPVKKPHFFADERRWRGDQAALALPQSVADISFLGRTRPCRPGRSAAGAARTSGGQDGRVWSAQADIPGIPTSTTRIVHRVFLLPRYGSFKCAESYCFTLPGATPREAFLFTPLCRRAEREGAWIHPDSMQAGSSLFRHTGGCPPFNPPSRGTTVTFMTTFGNPVATGINPHPATAPGPWFGEAPPYPVRLPQSGGRGFPSPPRTRPRAARGGRSNLFRSLATRTLARRRFPYDGVQEWRLACPRPNRARPKGTESAWRTLAFPSRKTGFSLVAGVGEWSRGISGTTTRVL